MLDARGVCSWRLIRQRSIFSYKNTGTSVLTLTLLSYSVVLRATYAWTWDAGVQGSHNRMSGCPEGYAGNSTLKKIHRAVHREILCAVLLYKDSPQTAAAWPGKFRVPRFPGHCGTFW